MISRLVQEEDSFILSVSRGSSSVFLNSLRGDSIQCPVCLGISSEEAAAAWETWKTAKEPPSASRSPRTRRFVWRKAAAARLRQACASGTGVPRLPRPDWPRAASRAGRPTRRARPAPWGWPMGRPQPRQPNFFCMPALLHLSHGGQPTPANTKFKCRREWATTLTHAPDADVQPVPGAEMANSNCLLPIPGIQGGENKLHRHSIEDRIPMILPSHPHAHRGRAMETVQPLQPPSTLEGIS